MGDNVIRTVNLTKEYKMYARKKDRLLEAVFPFYKKHTVFKAVNNINLEVNKGEILGILGRNGAGKSTLLKMLTGVVTPTSGTIEMSGKISSLLELGISFNPELDGIQNIYQHGQVMGLTNEEIDAKRQEIIDFADIGDHLYQPVKTYSSGMFARLAFSCAINVNPDILIVDEVLSVGDMAFQEKSITKMKQIRERGTTILFVSHSIDAVRNFCDRAIWIDSGKLVLDGSADYVTEEYKKNMVDIAKEEEVKENAVKSVEVRKSQIDKKSIVIKSVKCNKNEYNLFDDIDIFIEIENIKKIKEFGVGLIIQNSSGDNITIMNSIRIDKIFNENDKSISFNIKRNCFSEGRYYITVSVCDEKIMFSYDKLEYAESFMIKVPKNKFGVLYSDGMYACDYTIDSK